jgi:hypothetical protein
VQAVVKLVELLQQLSPLDKHHHGQLEDLRTSTSAVHDHAHLLGSSQSSRQCDAGKGF